MYVNNRGKRLKEGEEKRKVEPRKPNALQIDVDGDWGGWAAGSTVEIMESYKADHSLIGSIHLHAESQLENGRIEIELLDGQSQAGCKSVQKLNSSTLTL